MANYRVAIDGGDRPYTTEGDESACLVWLKYQIPNFDAEESPFTGEVRAIEFKPFTITFTPLDSPESLAEDLNIDPEPEQDQESLKEFNEDEARQLIELADSIALLEKWGKAETRKGVNAAIAARIKELQSGK